MGYGIAFDAKPVSKAKQARLDFIEAKCNEVRRFCESPEIRAVNPPYALGHAFLWGVIDVPLKNGKVKPVRECLCGVCASDLNALARAVEQGVPGVSRVTYNLD